MPALDKGGGVPSVAQFIKDAAHRSGRYEIKLISLCMAGNEGSSRLLRSPSTWLRGPISVSGRWKKMQFSHIGANWAELEFQRYKPREILSEAVSSCDLIQVVSGCPAWANSVLGLGKPVSLQVATLVSVERKYLPHEYFDFKYWWRKLMTTLVSKLDIKTLKSVDAIQVENPWMFKFASSITVGRLVDLRYAPPGVDADRFKPSLDRNLELDPYILCVGRMNDARKNIEMLLEAYAVLPNEIKNNVKLVLAGAAPPPLSFWNRAKELQINDGIIFHEKPSKEVLISLYQKASLFALPSFEEGLGIVVLEAMACGLPTVSTKCGGPEGIITDGEDGFLVPLNDIEFFSKRLAMLLTDHNMNKKMSKAARVTIENKYEECVSGKEFIDTWDCLLTKPF